MALPGFPDGPGEAWWRIEQATPPAYVATGDLAAGSTAVANFSASYRGQPIVPLVGQLVSGLGVPPGAAVAATPAPSASAFALTVAAAQDAPAASLQVGAEPLQVADAKKWARIQYSVDDDIVTRLIVMARRLVEGPELKKALLLQSRTMYFASFPWGGAYGLVARGFGLNPWWFPSAQGVIQMPYPPLISVDAINYIDAGGTPTVMDPANYIYSTNATPGRLQPVWGTVWPIARPQIDAVSITFTCGYGASPSDLPEEVIEGLCMLVSSFYRNRESDAEYELKATRTFRRAMAGEELGYYN